MRPYEQWSVRLACAMPTPHFTIVKRLKDDGIEWCPQCRKYRQRVSVAPYEGSTRRRKRKPVEGESPTLATLFDAEQELLPPF